MQTAFFLFSAGLATLLFVLGKRMKTIPRWLAIVGYDVAIFLGLLGVLSVFNVLNIPNATIIGLCIMLISYLLLDNAYKGHKADSWLNQVLESDLNNLSNRIFWREYVWQFQGFNNIDPYFDMTVTLINANIYSITVEGIDGRFLIAGQPCAYPAELLFTPKLEHGESSSISMRQRISEEMKKFIIKQRDSEGTLKVTPCSILLQPWIQGERAVWVKLGGESIIPIKQLLASYIPKF